MKVKTIIATALISLVSAVAFCAAPGTTKLGKLSDSDYVVTDGAKSAKAAITDSYIESLGFSKGGVINTNIEEKLVGIIGIDANPSVSSVTNHVFYYGTYEEDGITYVTSNNVYTWSSAMRFGRSGNRFAERQVYESNVRHEETILGMHVSSGTVWRVKQTKDVYFRNFCVSDELPASCPTFARDATTVDDYVVTFPWVALTNFLDSTDVNSSKLVSGILHIDASAVRGTNMHIVPGINFGTVGSLIFDEPIVAKSGKTVFSYDFAIGSNGKVGGGPVIYEYDFARKSDLPGDYESVSNAAMSAKATLDEKSGMWDAKQDKIDDYTPTNAVKDLISEFTPLPDLSPAYDYTDDATNEISRIKRGLADLKVYEEKVVGFTGYEIAENEPGLLDAFRASTPVYAPKVGLWGLNNFVSDRWSFELVPGQPADAEIIRYVFVDDFDEEHRVNASVRAIRSISPSDDRIATENTSVPFEKIGGMVALDREKVALKSADGGVERIAGIQDVRVPSAEDPDFAKAVRAILSSMLRGNTYDSKSDEDMKKLLIDVGNALGASVTE